jgi:hypothetical protein
LQQHLGNQGRGLHRPQHGKPFVDHGQLAVQAAMTSSAEYARVKAMREAGGQGTRNLSDIARKDPRLQEIHERLEANKRGRT